MTETILMTRKTVVGRVPFLPARGDYVALGDKTWCVDGHFVYICDEAGKLLEIRVGVTIAALRLAPLGEKDAS